MDDMSRDHDTRPDDHTTPGALTRDMPCGHCGHPGDHRYGTCDDCSCGVLIPAPRAAAD